MGRVPVPISVELREDLAGCAAPGDVATLVGIVKVINGGDPVGGGGAPIAAAAGCRLAADAN